MIEINMFGAGIGVGDTPGQPGVKRLVIVDQQTNIRVFLDLDPDSVEKLIGMFRGVTVATRVPLPTDLQGAVK